MDDTKAFMAYIQIMNNVTPEDPDDCTKEYVLSLRKLMLRDEFLKAKKSVQTKFLKFVEKAITSLELRTSLDIMSKEGLQLLEPQQPIQPLQPPMPQQAPGGILLNISAQQPGAPQQGMPGSPQPPQPMGGAIPPPQNPMNGTPIQNPAAPTSPNMQNPQQLPQV
jgi:hypothetical protein